MAKKKRSHKVSEVVKETVKKAAKEGEINARKKAKRTALETRLGQLTYLIGNINITMQKLDKERQSLVAESNNVATEIEKMDGERIKL